MVRRSRHVSLMLAVLVPAVDAFVASGLASGSMVSSGSKDSLLAGRIVATAAAASNDGWWFEDYSPSDSNDNNNNNKPNKLDDESERMDLTSRKSSSKEDVSQFYHGEELKQLRSDLESYRENLKWARAVDDKARVQSLSEEIEEKEAKDPEVVYNKARALIVEAKGASRSVLSPKLKDKLIKHWSKQATLARDCLPRFHMEGYV